MSLGRDGRERSRTIRWPRLSSGRSARRRRTPPIGRCARWPRKAAFRTRRSGASGAPSACSRTARRPSSSPAIRCSWTRSATSQVFGGATVRVLRNSGRGATLTRGLRDQRWIGLPPASTAVRITTTAIRQDTRWARVRLSSAAAFARTAGQRRRPVSRTMQPASLRAALTPGGTTQVASYSSTITGPSRASARSARPITSASHQPSSGPK